MDNETKRERFAFGANWSAFLGTLDEERIAEAEKSLRTMLKVRDLKGLAVLDAGSGSGLFSLAAMRLGASRVHSFDYDPQSVACAAELKARYFPEARNWRIEQGSLLDSEYLKGLGAFDLVYCWGVLHHTGAMWSAMENIIPAVEQGGRLFIAIYNDQGRKSRLWRRIKKGYVQMPDFLKFPYAVLVWTPFEAISVVGQLVRGRKPWQPWVDYKRSRGMSRWHDIVDWIGGYPFETATPEAVFRFFRDRGFVLEELVTRQGLGCNEFVLRRGRPERV